MDYSHRVNSHKVSSISSDITSAFFLSSLPLNFNIFILESNTWRNLANEVSKNINIMISKAALQTTIQTIKRSRRILISTFVPHFHDKFSHPKRHVSDLRLKKSGDNTYNFSSLSTHPSLHHSVTQSLHTFDAQVLLFLVLAGTADSRNDELLVRDRFSKSTTVACNFIFYFLVLLIILVIWLAIMTCSSSLSSLISNAWLATNNIISSDTSPLVFISGIRDGETTMFSSCPMEYWSLHISRHTTSIRKLKIITMAIFN